MVSLLKRILPEVLQEHHSKICVANFFGLDCYTLQQLIPPTLSQNFVHYRLWNA
jgi:hypothetical protein